MSDQSIHSGIIIQELFAQNWRQNQICLTNSFCWGAYESDFMQVTHRGYMHEFEIKVTRSDFHADFKKDGGRGTKHETIKAGGSKLATFSFVVPAGLIEASQVPEHAGLIYAEAKGWRVLFHQIKKAPRLHGAKALEPGKIVYLLRKSYVQHAISQVGKIYEARKSRGTTIDPTAAKLEHFGEGL